VLSINSCHQITFANVSRTTSKCTRKVGHVVLIVKYEGKKTLGTLWHRREDNIEMDI
jgi:hypothetical protein